MFNAIHKSALAVITLAATVGTVHAGTARLGFRAEFCEYGMVVVAVDYAGPAHQVGLVPGDIIVQINEHRIACFADYFRALEDAAWNHGGHVELWFYRPGIAGFDLLYVEFTLYQQQIIVHVPCCIHPVKCYGTNIHCWRDKLVHLNIWFNKHCGSHKKNHGGSFELPIGKLPGVKLQGLIDKSISIGPNFNKLNGLKEALGGSKSGSQHGIQLQNLGVNKLENLKNLGIRLNKVNNLNGASGDDARTSGSGNPIKLKRKLTGGASPINSNIGMSLRNLSASSGSSQGNGTQSFQFKFGKR